MRVRLHGGWAGRRRVLVWLTLLTAALLAAVTAPTRATAAPTPTEPAASASALGSLGEVSPVAPLVRVRAHMRKRARKGVSLTASTTEAHWACPEEPCEAIVDPEPLVVTVNGRRRFKLPDGPLLEGSGEKGGFDPQDLQSAYKIPTAGGEGQTVALVDAYGYSTAEEDLAKYRERYGLPPCTKADGCFEKVNQKGEEANYPPNHEGWETESALDIEMASAACPHCKIMLAEAKSASGPDLRETVNTAARLGATEISNSYGSSEQNCGNECAEELSAYDHPGILITASAGDNGFDNGQKGSESPNIPAGFPAVVSVGGTALHHAANARGWSEEVWSGGGSGCTALWAKPVWQSDPGCANRMEDDVAAVAACETPLSTYSHGHGGWEDVCGTSASSPLVAGIEAHASEYARSLPGADAFYQDPEAFFDVTAGSNGTCTPPAAHAYWCHAEPGYDGPTGVGTPDGPMQLSSAPAPVVLTAPASDVAGGAATLNGAVGAQGLEASYHFEYGTTTAYGTSVPVPDASAGSSRTPVQVSQSIGGLEPETVYHYRLVASNVNGTSYGSDGEFVTAPPTVSSVSPSFGATDGGTAVTVTGTNFEGVLTVRFGTRETQSFTVNSPTSITAVSPQGAGTADVVVTTSAGSSETSAADHYVYDTVGPVLSWGYGKLLGDGSRAQSDVPVEVSELPEAVGLAAGGTQSLAQMPGGTVMAWGEGKLGSIGNGSDLDSEVPIEVCAPAAKPQTSNEPCPSGPYLEEVTAVAAGGFASVALLKDGTVVDWGGNGRGQLGADSEADESDVPVPVCAAKELPCKPENYLRNVVAVSAGERYSLALLKNGTVMAWGENAQGELGTGKTKGLETCIDKTIACSRVPVPVAHLEGVSAIAAGGYDALALLESGEVVAWGADEEGQLGDGASEQKDSPTPVCAAGELAPCSHLLDNVHAVTAGAYTGAAVLDDGTVVDWGSNFNGGLGDGSLAGPETCGTETESCSRSPVKVSGLSEVSAIAVGVEDTAALALTRAGAVMTWGGNQFGQLGDGAAKASAVPVQVCPAFATAPCPDGPFLSGEVLAIAAGGFHDLIGMSTSQTAITSVDPAAGPGAGGTRVTITGKGLSEVSAVHFGASSAREFEVVSDSELVAVSPPGSGVVNITVTTPAGGSHVGIANEFSYETSTVTSITPASGSSGGGTAVTIQGTKLSPASSVRFGAAPATEYEVVSPEEIRAVSPPGTGVVDVTVTTPEGTSPPTQGDHFLYQGAPAVQSEPAGAIHLSSAVLNATVDPEGGEVTDCHFEYGTSTAYGTSVPCSTAPGSGSSPVPVSVLITGLEAAVTYHFRIVATNAEGTGYGDDGSFTTPVSEPPEVGRCVKLLPPTGAYKTSSCTTASAGGNTGKYEWHPGPGSHRGFSASAGASTFALAGNGFALDALKCSASHITGTYTGAQSASLSLLLSGCFTELGNDRPECHSEGAAEGQVATNLRARLGIISTAKSKPSLGWALEPQPGGELAQFTCGGEALAIGGAVIGTVSPVDKMGSSLALAFAASKTHAQSPESFAGGGKQVPLLIIGKEQYPLILTTSATLAGEEQLELKGA